MKYETEYAACPFATVKTLTTISPEGDETIEFGFSLQEFKSDENSIAIIKYFTVFISIDF